MLRTYKAILRGNQVEWCGDVGELNELDHTVPVHITALDEPVSEPKDATRGKSMVSALRQLAAMNTVVALTDPAVWEREIRQDRKLPDRQN